VSISTDPSVFTSLHRWLGRGPQPLTIELLDAAVGANLEETADLDFKLDPPSPSALAQSDLAKDFAAMANSGGGTLVFGVRDNGSRAVEAPGVEPGFTADTYVRDVRRVALNRVSPPILNLAVYTFTDGSRHSLAVVVPPTNEAPHLIFVGDSFRAPYRNGPDTAWMTERMLESAYRARFNARHERENELREILGHALGPDHGAELWIGAIARPAGDVAYVKRLEREQVQAILDGALKLADAWVRLKVHPLEWLDRSNPRPGLRRWVARFGRTSETTRWREAQAQIFDSGTVVLTAAMGGGRGGADTFFGPHEVGSDRVETFIADFTALVRLTAIELGLSAYEMIIDFRRPSDSPIMLRIPDSHLGGYYLDPEYSSPIHHFVPVEAIVNAATRPELLLDHLREIALDVVNQGGVRYLHSIEGPAGQ